MYNSGGLQAVSSQKNEISCWLCGLTTKEAFEHFYTFRAFRKKPLGKNVKKKNNFISRGIKEGKKIQFLK
jgi:hypothetical protein